MGGVVAEDEASEDEHHDEPPYSACCSSAEHVETPNSRREPALGAPPEPATPRDWVHALAATCFFQPCATHTANPLKSKRNFWCPARECSLCPQCVAGQAGHAGGECIQVYRYMYNDVIRLEDFGHLLDLEGIQTYLANNHHAVHLRPWEVSKGKSPVGFTNSCEGGCGRMLYTKWRFCSLRCKLALLPPSSPATSSELRSPPAHRQPLLVPPVPAWSRRLGSPPAAGAAAAGVGGPRAALPPPAAAAALAPPQPGSASAPRRPKIVILGGLTSSLRASAGGGRLWHQGRERAQEHHVNHTPTTQQLAILTRPRRQQQPPAVGGIREPPPQEPLHAVAKAKRKAAAALRFEHSGGKRVRPAWPLPPPPPGATTAALLDLDRILGGSLSLGQGAKVGGREGGGQARLLARKCARKSQSPERSPEV
ncbi:hypothetical protein N2152v2_002572 [Parachlorella kessleri]